MRREARDPERIEETLTLAGSVAWHFTPGGAPLRVDPRLMSEIPTGCKANNAELLSYGPNTLKRHVNPEFLTAQASAEPRTFR